jgi:hypothetical protein
MRPDEHQDPVGDLARELEHARPGGQDEHLGRRRDRVGEAGLPLAERRGLAAQQSTYSPHGLAQLVTPGLRFARPFDGQEARCEGEQEPPRRELGHRVAETSASRRT